MPGLLGLGVRRLPIVAEELDRMLRPDRAAAAGEIVGGTELVATPTDALGMARMPGSLVHVSRICASL
jgi:hypothetical protein